MSNGTEATLTLDTTGLALNVAAFKSAQPLVALDPRVNYNVGANELRPGCFSLYLKTHVQAENVEIEQASE